MSKSLFKKLSAFLRSAVTDRNSSDQPVVTSAAQVAELADQYYQAYVPPDESDPYHAVLPTFIANCNSMPHCKVLELGAREVTGVSRRKLFVDAVDYVGFDIHRGPGVDVAGDAHELSKYFPENSFDALFSISVFEHLAFPWKVAMEINRVLRLGGICYVSTHPCWPPHELPWDFWRFPLAGLELLFSEATGFRVRSSVEGLPARLHSLAPDPPARKNYQHTMSMGVALIAEKIADYDRDRVRWDVPLPTVLKSEYPNRTRE